MARIRVALKLDGVNLLPYLKAEVSTPPHDTLYWRFGEQWAIRKGDWKLVVNRIDGPAPRLFNLAQDIGEAKDLTAESPDKARELKALYDAWNAEQMEPRWPKAGEAKKKKKDKTSPKAAPVQAPTASGDRSTPRVDAEPELPVPPQPRRRDEAP